MKIRFCFAFYKYTAKTKEYSQLRGWHMTVIFVEILILIHSYQNIYIFINKNGGTVEANSKWTPEGTVQQEIQHHLFWHTNWGTTSTGKLEHFSRYTTGEQLLEIN